MEGIQVVEIDEDEFLELEECIGAAERLAAASKQRQASISGQDKALQGKRDLEAAPHAKDVERVQRSKMPCTTVRGVQHGPQLLQPRPPPQQQQQQQQQQHQLQQAEVPGTSRCMQQQQPHLMLGLQDNFHQRTCGPSSATHALQQQQHQPLGCGLQQQNHGCLERHQQQRNAHSQQHQTSISQHAISSMAVQPVGCWSGGSISSGLQRQQSTPELESTILQQQWQQLKQPQLPWQLPQQQQSHQQLGYRLQRSPQHWQPQQQHARQQGQQGQHCQAHATGTVTGGAVSSGYGAVSGASSSGGFAQHICQPNNTNAGKSSVGGYVCARADVGRAGTQNKLIDQHGNASKFGSNKTAAAAAAAATTECCADNDSQGQQTAVTCRGCVTGVINPHATASVADCMGPGRSAATSASVRPPSTAYAGTIHRGSGGAPGAHGCSGRSGAGTQASGGATQGAPSSSAGLGVGDSGGGCAGPAVSGGRQAALCNSGDGKCGAAPASAFGSSRRLPASLVSSNRAPVAARGTQGPAARVQLQQGQQGQQGETQQLQPSAPQKALQLEYHGQVHYAYQPGEVDWLCQQLLDAGPPGVVGLDLEWRPTYRKGCAPNKAALLQLAYAVDKHGKDWRPKPDGKGVTVLLLHVLYSGITPQLQNILSREDIVKVGVNIGGDANKLLADFNVGVENTSELSDIANRRQLSCVDGITSNIEHKRWSLAGLVNEVVCAELPKPNDIRCGNWEKVPLEKDQKCYAALDAFACLLLHWELQDLPERLTLSQQLRQGMMERAAAATTEDEHA